MLKSYKWMDGWESLYLPILRAPLCGANNNIEYYRILYATFSLPLTGRVDVEVLLVLIVRLEVVADLVVSVVSVGPVR